MNNRLRPRHKVVSQLMIYSTTRCQSRCRHCSIWQKPEENLSLEDIIKVMDSRCITAKTTVGLEGGEFILHPEADRIMEWFAANHPNYTLLTNCLAPEKVIGAVRKYRPAHLYVSLDGDRDTYIRMRGRDGYDKVIEVVETVKDTVPTSLMFCLSPWNSFKDMEFVTDIAKKYGIDIRIGIYGTMAFFDTNGSLLEADADSFVSSIPANVRLTDENYDFIALYEEWRNGNLRLRCHSIFSAYVIHSNGDVPLCQNLDVVLGNIHQQSFDEIINSRETCGVQQHYSRRCNECWINFHRKYDIILARNFEKMLPKKVVERFYGQYNWTADKSMTYSKYFENIKPKSVIRL